MEDKRQKRSRSNHELYLSNKIKKAEALANAIAAAKNVLLCLVTYSRFCFTSVSDHLHSAAQFILTPGACKDVLSSNNEDVIVRYEDQDLSIVDIYNTHNLIPTYLVLLVEVLTTGDSPLGVRLLKLTTGRSFWRDVEQSSPSPNQVSQSPRTPLA